MTEFQRTNSHFEFTAQVALRQVFKIHALQSHKKTNCSQLAFAQMPQPMHSSSDMNAILSAGATSIHSFPARKEIFLNTEADNKQHINDCSAC